MTNEQRETRPLLRDLLAVSRGFARDEDGMVTIFAFFMIFCMMMIGGIGVDMMRHEMERTRIQAVADRAVLAAADLDQTLDPEFVVRDYFTKSGIGDFVSMVNVDEGLNYRTVTVDASTDVNTMFMDYMGVQTLHVPGLSTAEEKVSKVEISLVLDISGSMKDNNKMQNLKNAASTFVDTVLDPANRDLISVTVVPYSEQVNVGPGIFYQLNIQALHDYSHCVEMQDQEFDRTRLNDTRNYQHMQHFQWNYYSIQSNNQLNTRYDTVCPRYGDPQNSTNEDYEAIKPFSQDANDLKDQISQFKPRAGTSIFLGMKWGVAMLDPDFQDLTAGLIGQGIVDPEFAGRPVAYSDEETMKTVILMTDGQNDKSYRIPNWYYNSESEIVHWKNYNLQYYMHHYVNPYYHSNFYQLKYTASHGDYLLDNICDAAKEQNIIIWTIGFETTDHGANVMRQCASSPSHFFRVEGVEITEAFSSIARQINQLRLTQ